MAPTGRAPLGPGWGEWAAATHPAAVQAMAVLKGEGAATRFGILAWQLSAVFEVGGHIEVAALDQPTCVS